VLRGRYLMPVVGFVLCRGRGSTCGVVIPRRHVYGELAGGVVWAGAAALVGPRWWLPALLVAPPAVLLLATPAVRTRGVRAVLVPLLVITGVALLVSGLGAASMSRWPLYLTSGVLALVVLVTAVWLERGAARSPAA